MNCETCQAKLPTLKTRLTRVNDALHKVGLKYWPLVGDAMREIDAALSANGFADMMNGTDESGNETSIHMNVGDGKWLHIKWYRMASGRYEVTAYVN